VNWLVAESILNVTVYAEILFHSDEYIDYSGHQKPRHIIGRRHYSVLNIIW
jgi:hypothetical protein